MGQDWVEIHKAKMIVAEQSSHIIHHHLAFSSAAWIA
jgi:hypothetical protein